jgi:hypothetical protein
MVVTCRLCSMRFETEGRASMCPHALLEGGGDASRGAAFDSTDRRLLQSAAMCLMELDKHHEAATILGQSGNPAMKALADECASLPDSSRDFDAQFQFRKKLERAGL